MNKININIAIFITALLSSGCKYYIVNKPTSLDSKKEDSAFVKSILEKSENGYWLVVRGYKVTDHMVAAATITDYSHAAILDLTTKSVIEADGSGIHESSIYQFVNHSYKITLVKPLGYGSVRGDIAVTTARNKIGKPYDFSGTLGLNDSTKYYCSELAAFCYPNIKDSIKLPRIIKPSNLIQIGTKIYETPERKVKK